MPASFAGGRREKACGFHAAQTRGKRGVRRSSAATRRTLRRLVGLGRRRRRETSPAAGGPSPTTTSPPERPARWCGARSTGRAARARRPPRGRPQPAGHDGAGGRSTGEPGGPPLRRAGHRLVDFMDRPWRRRRRSLGRALAGSSRGRAGGGLARRRTCSTAARHADRAGGGGGGWPAKPPRRMGSQSPLAGAERRPSRPADGHVQVVAYNERQWRAICTAGSTSPAGSRTPPQAPMRPRASSTGRWSTSAWAEVPRLRPHPRTGWPRSARPAGWAAPVRDVDDAWRDDGPCASAGLAGNARRPWPGATGRVADALVRAPHGTADPAFPRRTRAIGGSTHRGRARRVAVGALCTWKRLSPVGECAGRAKSPRRRAPRGPRCPAGSREIERPRRAENRAWNCVVCARGGE